MNLDQVKSKMEDENVLIDVAELFKVLGDSTRVKILTVLEQGEFNVTDICECVGMNKSAISHQLRILRQSKLVKSNKIGKEVFYSLDDDHVSQIFDCAITHIKE